MTSILNNEKGKGLLKKAGCLVVCGAMLLV